MKEIYSYQEIGTRIDEGTPVAFTRSLEAHVTAAQHSRDSDTITAIIRLCLGDYFLGEVESEFASIAAFLKAFAIHDRAEMWEVLE